MGTRKRRARPAPIAIADSLSFAPVQDDDGGTATGAAAEVRTEGRTHVVVPEETMRDTAVVGWVGRRRTWDGPGARGRAEVLCAEVRTLGLVGVILEASIILVACGVKQYAEIRHRSFVGRERERD